MIEEIASVIARYNTKDDGLLLRVATTVLPAIEAS